MHKIFVRILFLPFIVFISVMCNRELMDPDPNALPSFSTDTVSFDTVFTTIGSATLHFKVYNRSSKPLLISSIALAGGELSFFRLNIDGEAVPSVKDVEIPPDDSLFLFVAVTVDPTLANNPIIVTDSIVFTTRGTLQQVKLLAYGQNVHLLKGELIGSQTWVNDKPYLIYNSIAVDTSETLTVEAGTRIYFHQNSSMIIWGKLLVNGTWEEPVVFQNDRLEEFYEIIPGQWGTLYIDPISQGNRINFAVIKNAIAGIQIGYPSDYRIPELAISNSIILNTSFTGIYAFGANLTCYNTVIANSAGPLAALLRGGSYRFQHCTLSNNGVIGTTRSNPSVVISNTFNNTEYDEASDQYVYVIRTGDLEEASFQNSIVYGSFSHEIQLVNNEVNQFDFLFDHCLLKAIEDSINRYPDNFVVSLLNEDPNFANDEDRYYLDYSLDTLSPAKDFGDPQLLLTYPYLEPDITGFLRTTDGKPDLGAFERKEE